MYLIKLITQLFTLFGGLYGFSIVWDATESLLAFLLYGLVYIAVNIWSAVWRMVDMSADEMKGDFKHAMAMSKRCPSCLKKLPSYFTSKCPHCTADL
jgi:hypothetical protein